MTSSWTKLKLLLWKNYVLQKRKPVITVIEIGSAALFAGLLLFVRQLVKSEIITSPTFWPAFSVENLTEGMFPVPNTLYYSPNTSAVTRDIMNDVQEHFGMSISGVIGYADENAMVNAIMNILNQKPYSHVLGGVVFEDIISNSSVLPRNITYKIRMAQETSDGSGDEDNWFTNVMFPIMQMIGPREGQDMYGGTPDYMIRGFLPLQRAVDEAVMKVLSPSADTSSVILNLQRFPYPPYNDDNFITVIQLDLPLLVMLSFVITSLTIVRDIVLEKEKKMKETLKMMGMSSWLQWLAWFIKYLIFLLIADAIITLFFCVKIGQYGSIIGYTNPLILIIYLILYSISIICFCFLVSVFFKSANSGAAAGGILFFCSYIPYLFLQPNYNTMSEVTKIAACLDMNVAMAFGAQVIGMFEGTGAGIQWSTLNQGASVDDSFTMLQVFLMLLLDSFIYCLIAFYIEAVFPGEYGVPQPWYFPVLKSFWCGTAKASRDNLGYEEIPCESSTEFFEKEPMGVKAGIRIHNLRKVFGNKVAVAGTSVNMFEGQITALLGHNGAGKTTTISMLTGFYPPTSGTALVNGYDIREDINSVRSSLGVCPQHDVLFDTLTVDEHLLFFAELKGCKTDQLRNEVDKMTESLGLSAKKNAKSKTLSGGMKRKLSVGIALVGGSEVVILDEPTSGMDPNARRQIWDILQRHRENRTMILTTHFMDEADVLGDRIAIMAEGVVKCCGSSLFLKNKYGAGYHMVIVKEPGCQVDTITKLVQFHVPNAQLESDISAELSYILPQDSTHQFEALFSQIEEKRGDLGIASYGASVTTMEEVFLRVGEGADINTEPEDRQENGTIPQSNGPIFNMDIEKNKGLHLLMQQFWAMFLKRALNTFRNWLVTATQLVVPLFFVTMGLLTLKIIPNANNMPPLTLNLDPFGENYVTFSSGINHTQSVITKALAKAYSKQFYEADVNQIYLNNDSTWANHPNVDDYLINEGKNSLGTYNNKYMIAASFLSTEDGVANVTAEFNDQAYHTPAMTLNAIDNTFLQYFVNSSYNLFTVNDPLPPTVKQQIQKETNSGFTAFTVSFNVMFGLAFLASSFAVFLISERTTKSKHSQFVSGVKWYTFWAATMVWDMINYLVPALLFLVVFAAFDISAYTDDHHLGYVFMLFLFFGWSMLPFMYLLSFMYDKPSSGFVWLTMINIIAGVATVLAVQILSIPGLNTQSVATGLQWVFLIFVPNYCLGQGLQDLYNNYQYLNVCTNEIVKLACQDPSYEMGCCKGHCGGYCYYYNENYLGWENGGIGRELVFMAVQGFAYLVILSLVESGLIRKLRYQATQRNRSKSRSSTGSGKYVRRSISQMSVEEDNDVAAERDRMTMAPLMDLIESNALALIQVTKYYGSALAVDRLSVGIKRGECFGLLGNNGAGKTTTFKMLTGDEAISSGDAFLEKSNVKTQINEVQSKLGYCPQFDALVERLTGRETLYMYARLRGIHESQIERMVQRLIDTLLLRPHADKLTSSYSGGNKRKLSTAIALVGNPPVVFLDEPTTGMDPVARRQLWDTLSRLRASGTTLVLTSHSMEECEALCTQIAIMVNGQVKCLGSTQHLKNKFGEGYTLIARVASNITEGEASTSQEMARGGFERNTNNLMSFIQSTFPCSILKDIHQNIVHYYIPTDPDLTWASIFGAIEKNKDRLYIEDYSVSQTTLEQVFINFARAQIAPQEINSSCMRSCRLCLCKYMCCCCCCCCNAGGNDDELTSIVDHEHRPPTYT